MDAQTLMMTLQFCETLAKKQEETGLSKEETLTYDKMLVAVGNYMTLTSIVLERAISKEEGGNSE